MTDKLNKYYAKPSFSAILLETQVLGDAELIIFTI